MLFWTAARQSVMCSIQCMPMWHLLGGEEGLKGRGSRYREPMAALKRM